MTAPEASVLIVIVIVAAVLAAAGLPTLSVLVLITEALSLGTCLLLRLRRNDAERARTAEA
ncbi:hypothetical protein [Streptomyces sp. GESEQ-4]|uniref:hypothetical protein n=1 Tax=Streptomyces sp. GESEQ-4 TaxID=2812655 RepID=UPI001B32FBAB|nr:hypothetical protein [Streptomyces sp. GESEQ-4]